MRDRTKYQIHNVVFEGDALLIGYIELPTDVRVKGRVVLQRQIRASFVHPDYADDAEILHDRVVKVLANILEDWESSDPYVPPTDDEEDEERGMGE